MSRVLRLTVILCAVLAIFSTLMIVYGRSQPVIEPYKQYGVEACNGHLCLHGIEPGVTRQDKAQEILKVTGLGRPQSLVRAELPLANDNAIVTEVFLYDFAPDSPSVGAVVVGYGWPCAATVEEGPDNTPGVTRHFTMWLDYQYFSVRVPLSLEPQFVRGGILDANSYIEDVIVHNWPDSCQLWHAGPDTGATFTTPWLGFGSIQKYLDYDRLNP